MVSRLVTGLLLLISIQLCIHPSCGNNDVCGENDDGETCANKDLLENKEWDDFLADLMEDAFFDDRQKILPVEGE
eukprot:CAMPEP_0197827812 /NCGR_PEP_ID=MMETSP1437-20131217/4517_1 /TAXON_ID=49252 ORGANISM="Eucampia antarctica, Strain CCMP1452" /NCGR_SAMPLE_ID=MMETSP1437 /ASSEMBLY_ACC=CAM_ASM_001096 /LENGTH=74 /DNA_ID=CAMNT_0043428803 /DNA_START=18 /DNA_END=239 /DNA_ORIENTATION=+